MMTKAIDWSVLITHMSRVQKMQGDLQARPAFLQDQLAKEVVAKQKQEQKEVVSTAETDGQLAIRPDREKDRYTGSYREKEKEEEEHSETAKEEDSAQESGQGDHGRHIDLKV